MAWKWSAVLEKSAERFCNLYHGIQVEFVAVKKRCARRLA
jgi:hypothetical protein